MFISTDAHIDEISVQSWGTKDNQAIYFGPLVIVLTDPEDCDELIRAATEAKTAMLTARAAAEDSGPGQVTP